MILYRKNTPTKFLEGVLHIINISMIYIDLIKSIMAIQPICITNLRVALREFLQVASLLQDVELQQQQLLKHHQFQTLHGQV